jgi:Zn-dependent protease with chaperone function
MTVSAVQLSQIHPHAFTHPLDRKATSALQQTPFLPDLLKKISQLGVEERLRAYYMHHSIQLGPRQLPSLWRMVNEVAERLGIDPPRAYVAREHGANAFTFGEHSHSIVLSSQLVDMMSDRELTGVIAHEMGHILCEHILYTHVGLTLTRHVGLTLAGVAIPALAKLIPGLGASLGALFFAWYRAAEYSADRAAVLILEDPEPLARCLSRLAGVPRRFEPEQFDLRLFVEQVKDYDEGKTTWSKIATIGMETFSDHPEPARRARAVMEWAGSSEYREILAGRYPTRFKVAAETAVQIEGVRHCPCCSRPVGQAAACGYCGLIQDARWQTTCPRGDVAGIDWKFCKVCGQPVRPDRRSENPEY